MAQKTEDYNYFSLSMRAQISNYFYEDSVLVVDFFTYNPIQKWSKYTETRTYVLPKNQHLITLPNKFRLFFDRIFKTGKQYNIKIECPEDKIFISNIIPKIFIAKYEVWIVNDDFMAWHVCELTEIDPIK